MKKLIIWDFDGVIADTEKLWLDSRMEILNKEYNTNWSFETANKNIGGMSDKDKQRVLNNLGIHVTSDFWEKAIKLDMQKMKKGFALTDGIENLFKLKEFDQCIATGGTIAKTELKIKNVGIEKYFPKEKVFTADLVEYGKPEPDLFLLAAETMGYMPQNCIVIEDSIAGLTAAKKAKMETIAFVKYSSETYIKEIQKMGITHIFDNMNDVKNFVLSKI